MSRYNRVSHRNITMKTENVDRTFKPRQNTRRKHSTHPKTSQNREIEASKRGIDVAKLRADIAFRTAKSRGLKKLRESSVWDSMTISARHQAEQSLITKLEAKRDTKKRALEMEFRYRSERGTLASDEDLMDIDEPVADDGARTPKKQRQQDSEEIIQDDGDETWVDCDGQEDWELIGEELADIQIKYERRRRLILTMLSARAVRAEREYQKYKARRDEERMHMEVDRP
jgi:hypothetical protein